MIIPIAGLLTSTGYLGYHLVGHNIVRNILGAEEEPGKRAEIAKDLQRLILSVYDDVQVDFNKPLVPNPIWKQPVPTIKWFSSASIEPVTLGMTETHFGVLIGVPNHYNYDKLQDLPRSLLEVRKFSLFKSRKNEKAREKIDVQKEPLDCDNCEAGEIGELINIDPQSENGKAYLESFVLSEKAKRFSIARELFIGDSYRPLIITTIIMTTTMLSVSISRLAVSKLGYLQAHLTQRLPFYSVATSASIWYFYNTIDRTNRYYTQSADTRALNLGESYKEGAVEYLTKTIQRHKALRALFDDYQGIYDQDGNVIEPMFRSRNVPVTERLEMAKNFKIKASTDH